MTINKIKRAMLELDPNQYIKCDMDNFAPYIYLDRPKHLIEMFYELTGPEQDEYEEWENRYLNDIQYQNSDDLIANMLSEIEGE